MPRPIRARIKKNALRHNLECIKSHLTQQGIRSRIWSVIKANAYGHGIEHAVDAFKGMTDGLAMLDFSEAVRCREAGWEGPILMLEGFFDATDLQTIAEYQLSAAVHSWHELDLLETYQGDYPIPVWVKLNSGMNRLGFPPHEYALAYQRLQTLKRVDVIGKMTHFANADAPLGIADQYEVFVQTTQALDGKVCVCNSAATWRYAEANHDWVRTGIVLYGSSPFSDLSAQDMGLLPAMTLEAEIIGIQTLQPGDAVGYGSRFIADKPMRIGIVSCGYADGYPRCAPDGTPVVVAGQRTQLLGRVSMDMLTVDLSALPEVGIGAPVVLWGDQLLAADEVATACQTIAYELFTGLTPRVPLVSES